MVYLKSISYSFSKCTMFFLNSKREITIFLADWLQFVLPQFYYNTKYWLMWAISMVKTFGDIYICMELLSNIPQNKRNNYLFLYYYTFLMRPCKRPLKWMLIRIPCHYLLIIVINSFRLFSYLMIQQICSDFYE